VAPLTRGGLQPAVIYECEESGSKVQQKGGGLTVNCMFNPFEYTVKKTNKYEAKFKDGSDVPTMEYKGAGEKTLTLKLYFDTYDDGDGEKKDVSQITRLLWQLMEVKKEGTGKKRPPPVAFEWGVFQFFAVITSITQKFTLFMKDGTPVRAEVDISFSQHMDADEYDRQNPTSGGAATERVWMVKAGDRLDLIAAEVYGKATDWRRIALHNHITNPLLLQIGQQLRIPGD
jgi:LysM repeat protein